MPRPAERRPKPTPHAKRVRHLIALDAQNAMTRLAARHEEMVQLFSRHRDRSALLRPLKSWFTDIAFADLVVLGTREQRAVNAFYECLEGLRWYLEFTEDMPGQVQLKLGQHLRGLRKSYEALTHTIGLPEADGAPVVEALLVARQTRVARAR